MRVLVAHSGLQHAHHLAQALNESDDLLAFWSGIPLIEKGRASRWRWPTSYRLRDTTIPRQLRKHYPIFPIAQRLITRLVSVSVANAVSHRLDHAFDKWIAMNVARLRPDMVVCYENSALSTFRAAKSIGAVCVLDAASIHYRVQTKRLTPIGRADPKWVETYKQAEIDLADAILTCSPFAAETYATAGVRRDKLFSCTLGAHLPEIGSIDKKSVAGCRFIFVGTLGMTKGIDLLLDIFERLQCDGVLATLAMVGGVADADLAARARTITGVTLLPFVPQPKLFELMAGFDCLLLPSRFDSFGMVVPEAMAVGVPAIVSDQVGARCIIEQHSDAGWILPLDPRRWRSKMLELIHDRRILRMAAKAAEVAAKDFTWDEYRSRVRTILRGIHDRHAHKQEGTIAPRRL